MGRYKNPNYHNEWYAKNKDRLKAKPGFKEAKSIADKKYYKKHKQKLLEYQKEYRVNNIDRIKKRVKQYYLENREYIMQKQREVRKTKEYKEYMKQYRKDNADKIREQERICGKRYAEKNIREISEAYVIGLLTNSKVGIFDTFEEARQFPELIKFHQSHLKFKRLCQQQSKTSQN